MEKKYLEMTKMLNFDVESIQSLIKNRKRIELDEYNKIAAIYDFVRNEILFGYNSSDLPDFNERDFVTKEIWFWVIIPELSEPPVRTLGATIPENESHIFR